MMEGTFLLGSGPEDNETAKTRRRRLHRVSEDVMPQVCLSLQEAPLGRVHILCLLSIDEPGLRTVSLLGTIAQENESLEVTKDLFKLIFFIQLMRDTHMPVAGGEKE